MLDISVYFSSCDLFGLSLVQRNVRMFILRGESGSAPIVLLNGLVLLKQPTRG